MRIEIGDKGTQLLKELILSVVLLVAANGVTPEPLEQAPTKEAELKSVTSEGVVLIKALPDEPDERRIEDTAENRSEPDQASEISVDAESDSEQPESDEPSSSESEDTVISAETPPDGSTGPGTIEPITLDELLQQARNTPHLQREALLARLAERRRLAVALRSTLEAAEQVAAFGKPGTQLLQDASLDTVVDAMIEEKRREGLEHNRSTQTSSLASAVETVSEVDERKEDGDSDAESGFDAWQPIYVVKDARGHAVGWRHGITGERKITVVGERSTIGGASVTVVGASTDGIGRYIVVNVDGERREIHL